MATQKVSVTLEVEAIEQARHAAGPRGLSSYLDAALYEKPRPGKSPKITGEVEAQLVVLACSDPPEGKARWTMQLLADTLVALQLVESISDSTVCDRLKKTNLSRGR